MQSVPNPLPPLVSRGAFTRVVTPLFTLECNTGDTVTMMMAMMLMPTMTTTAWHWRICTLLLFLTFSPLTSSSSTSSSLVPFDDTPVDLFRNYTMRPTVFVLMHFINLLLFCVNAFLWINNAYMLVALGAYLLGALEMMMMIIIDAKSCIFAFVSKRIFFITMCVGCVCVRVFLSVHIRLRSMLRHYRFLSTAAVSYTLRKHAPLSIISNKIP